MPRQGLARHLQYTKRNQVRVVLTAKLTKIRQGTMSLFSVKSGVLEVCLLVGTGVGLILAVLIQVQFPPSDVRDFSPKSQVTVDRMAEA